MPRVRAAAGFSGLIESDSEPDFDNFQSSRPMSTLVPAKSAGAVKARGRPPANAHKVTKPVQKTAPRAHTNTTARQALQDKPANTDTKGRSYKDMGDSDMEPDLVKPVQPTRARPNPTIPTTKVSHKSSSLQGRPPKARAVETVAESDPEDAMELDDGDGGEDEGEDVNKEELEDSHIDYVEPSRTTRKHSTDDDTDSLRAELEELRRRYGSLEARHKELREVGVKEAERNYDRLKRQADENSAGKSAYTPQSPGRDANRLRKLRASSYPN